MTWNVDKLVSLLQIWFHEQNLNEGSMNGLITVDNNREREWNREGGERYEKEGEEQRGEKKREEREDGGGGRGTERERKRE